MFEIREIKYKAEYNPLLISKQTPFTQAWFYGEWQEMMGRKVRRFEVKKDSEIIGFFQIIKYPLTFSQNILYIPHGPIFRASFAEVASATKAEQGYEGQAEFLKEFHKKLFEIGEEENAIFARFDFYPALTANLGKYFKKVSPYAYNSVYFQPKFEWFVDLTKTKEKILSGMHPKTRYNIGLAQRKRIKIEIISENFKKYFSDFFCLLEETAKRDDFNLHPKIYYENIFSALDRENAFLAVAKYGEKILLVNLILFFSETAYFVFGGSSDEHKNLMAPHLSHWQGIIEAKNRGYKFYNFGGVGADGDRQHWEGISRFKKGFGGKLIEYSDSYDLVLKPFWHWLYNLRKWVLNLK